LERSRSRDHTANGKARVVARPDVSLAERDFPHTAIEIAQILAHAIEREPEGEDAFRGVDSKSTGKTFAANGGERLGIAV
jgi:hypothetical protein